MLIVHTEKHRLHNPEMYFALGRYEKYPEQPSRVETILQAIKQRQVGELIEPDDFGLELILACHTRDYVEYIQTAYNQWIVAGGAENGVIPDTYAVHLKSVYRDIIKKSDNILAKMGLYTFDSATVIAKDTFTAAYEATQVALTAADKLITKKLDCAFALCRPPGHHSAEELLGGFCFFNNAAIASKYLVNKGYRVCILDIDYHHGNGTQEIFYCDANPKFVSIHAEGSDPYFWGSSECKGEGEGLGYNVNVNLPNHTGDQDYLMALKETIELHVKTFTPDILVISLGVDTFEGDPVGTFQITSPCFVKIGEMIRTVGCPTLFVMEGGYDSPELGENVCNVLQGFEGVYTSEQ
jgi:acetoin utilization deacetylase AcuC-like enzyme